MKQTKQTTTKSNNNNNNVNNNNNNNDENYDLQSALRAIRRLDEAYLESVEQLKKLEKFKEEYDNLDKTLLALPNEISHKIMVPLSGVGFMPGKLVHTNEIMVLLGENYFVKRSAQQAREMISRRLPFLEENIKKAKDQVSLYKTRENSARKLTTEKESGVVDIREDYNEEEEEAKEKKKQKERNKLWKDFESKVNPKEEKKDDQHEKLMQRLAQLTLEEEEAEKKKGSGGGCVEENDQHNESDDDEDEYDEEETFGDDSESDGDEEEEGLNWEKQKQELDELHRQYRENPSFIMSPNDIYEYVRQNKNNEISEVNHQFSHTSQQNSIDQNNNGKDPSKKFQRRVSFNPVVDVLEEDEIEEEIEEIEEEEEESDVHPLSFKFQAQERQPNKTPTTPPNNSKVFTPTTPFSGNIVERNTEALPVLPPSQPKKISKFMQSRST